MKQQRFTKVRVLHGGSEVTNSPRTFLNGVNSRRDINPHDFIDQNTEAEVVLLPPKSPNLNAYMERWFRSLKSECLDRMIFFGRKSLENAVREYVEHYHAERTHQGLDNELIEPVDDPDSVAGRIECRERLGGLLKYYHRRAA